MIQAIVALAVTVVVAFSLWQIVSGVFDVIAGLFMIVSGALLYCLSFPVELITRSVRLIGR